MTNVNAPFGFRYFGRAEGGSPTSGLTSAIIDSAYNVAIGFGDAVIPVGGGGIQVATASTVPMFGIFAGCEYYNTAIGRKVWSPNWPGSGNSGNGLAYVYSDPQAWFEVQTDGTSPMTVADINANAQLVAGTVNSFGFSTMTVSHTSAGTSTYPFRIVGLLSQFVPANSQNGTDDASAYNIVIVTGNNWARTNTTGI